MADLGEAAVYHSGIYQIEITDAVIGGAPNLATKAGVANIPNKLLADRTAWLKAFVDGMTTDSEVQLTKDLVYNSQRANTEIRMGSDQADNWDGIFFVDGSNTFTFIADSAKASGEPGDSTIIVDKVRIVSQGDAGEESTSHGLEIGDFDSGNGARFDPNEVTFKATDGSTKSVFWGAILQQSDVNQQGYFSADLPNGYLLAENIKGDTAATLGDFQGYLNRVGDFVTLTFQFEVGGFSVPVSDDDPIEFRLDIGAIAQDAGWFSAIESRAYGTAISRFSGADWDAPSIPLVAVAATTRDAFPDTILFNAQDTRDQPSQSSNATSLRVTGQITFFVSD